MLSLFTKSERFVSQPRKAFTKIAQNEKEVKAYDDAKISGIISKESISLKPSWRVEVTQLHSTYSDVDSELESPLEEYGSRSMPLVQMSISDMSQLPGLLTQVPNIIKHTFFMNIQPEMDAKHISKISFKTNSEFSILLDVATVEFENEVITTWNIDDLDDTNSSNSKVSQLIEFENLCEERSSCVKSFEIKFTVEEPPLSDKRSTNIHYSSYLNDDDESLPTEPRGENKHYSYFENAFSENGMLNRINLIIDDLQPRADRNNEENCQLEIKKNYLTKSQIESLSTFFISDDNLSKMGKLQIQKPLTSMVSEALHIQDKRSSAQPYTTAKASNPYQRSNLYSMLYGSPQLPYIHNGNSSLRIKKLKTGEHTSTNVGVGFTSTQKLLLLTEKINVDVADSFQFSTVVSGENMKSLLYDNTPTWLAPQDSEHCEYGKFDLSSFISQIQCFYNSVGILNICQENTNAQSDGVKSLVTPLVADADLAPIQVPSSHISNVSRDFPDKDQLDVQDIAEVPFTAVTERPEGTSDGVMAAHMNHAIDELPNDKYEYPSMLESMSASYSHQSDGSSALRSKTSFQSTAIRSPSPSNSQQNALICTAEVETSPISKISTTYSDSTTSLATLSTVLSSNLSESLGHTPAPYIIISDCKSDRGKATLPSLRFPNKESLGHPPALYHNGATGGSRTMSSLSSLHPINQTQSSASEMSQANLSKFQLQPAVDSYLKQYENSSSLYSYSTDKRSDETEISNQSKNQPFESTELSASTHLHLKDQLPQEAKSFQITLLASEVILSRRLSLFTELSKKQITCIDCPLLSGTDFIVDGITAISILENDTLRERYHYIRRTLLQHKENFVT